MVPWFTQLSTHIFVDGVWFQLGVVEREKDEHAEGKMPRRL